MKKAGNAFIVSVRKKPRDGRSNRTQAEPKPFCGFGEIAVAEIASD
jgi:hypothetical protein